MKGVRLFLLLAFTGLAFGCSSGDAPKSGSVNSARPPIPATAKAALSVAPTGKREAELSRDVVNGLLSTLTERRNLLKWVERDPLEVGSRSQALSEFRTWLEEAASYQPEMFDSALSNDQLRVLHLEPASRQLNLLVRGLARRGDSGQSPGNVKPLRLPSGIDPLLMFDELFGHGGPAIALLDELVIGYPRNRDEAKSPRSQDGDQEWQRIKADVQHVEKRNRDLIERAIRRAVSDQRAANIDVSMARLYAEMPFAVSSWLEIDRTTAGLRKEIADLDETSKELFLTLSKNRGKTQPAKTEDLQLRQERIAATLAAKCRDVNEALLKRLDRLRGRTTTGEIAVRWKDAWNEIELLATRATHLYSQSTASTRVIWPGREDESIQLVCLPDEKLNEKAAAGVHLAEPVRVVLRDGKLDVAREGAASLVVSTAADVLSQDVNTGMQEATVQQFWDLDFGIRAHGLDWSVRELPPDGGENGATWQLVVEQLAQSTWVVDGRQFESQLRSLGLSQAVSVDHVTIAVGPKGPRASISLYVPAIGTAPAISSSVDIDFDVIDLQAVAAAIRAGERRSLISQIKNLDPRSEIPSLIAALGGRRAVIRSVRPGVGDRLEFTIEAELQTNPAIPVDLFCQPLANGRLAISRVETPITLARTLLGGFDAKKITDATTAFKDSLAKADHLADSLTEVIARHSALQGFADLAPNHPELDSALEDLRARLHASLRHQARNAVDYSHMGMNSIFLETSERTIDSVMAEGIGEWIRRDEIVLVGKSVVQELARIRTAVASFQAEDGKIAELVKILKAGLAAEHSLADDKLPDLTNTVKRFLQSVRPPAGTSAIVSEDELARLGRMVSITLSQHVQDTLQKAAALPVKASDWSDEQRRVYASALQPFLLPIADARSLPLKDNIRQSLTKQLELVLAGKRELLEKELSKIDLSGLSLEILWQNEQDKNAIRSVVRSVFGHADSKATEARVLNALQRLSLTAGPPESILTSASFDARLLQRLGNDEASAAVREAKHNLEASLGRARGQMAEFAQTFGDLELALRIDIDRERGPILDVRGQGRLELPPFPKGAVPTNFIDLANVTVAGRIFEGGSEVDGISKKLQNAAEHTRRLNQATEKIKDTANREIAQSLRRDARRELLAGPLNSLGSSAKNIEQTLKDARDAVDPKTFDTLTERLHTEINQALGPIEALAGHADALHRQVSEWIAALKDDEKEVKARLEAILPRLEKATTPELLTAVKDLLDDTAVRKQLEAGRTAEALKALQATWEIASKKFVIDDHVDDLIRELKGLSVSTSKELLGGSVPEISVTADGRLNLSIDGLPAFTFENPRLLAELPQASEIEHKIKAEIESRKKEIESEISKVQKDLVTKATEFRTRVENDLRNVGDQLSAELQKLKLPDSVSLFGRGFVISLDTKLHRIAIKDNSVVLFAIKATLERPGQAPSFQFEAPIGGRLSNELMQTLDAELKKLLGAETLTLLNGRLDPDGRCLITAKLQPDKFPVPVVVELTLRFLLPAEANGWKPGIEIEGVKTNAEAALAAAIDVFVKDLTENSETLGIGPLKIDPTTLKRVNDDPSRPFRSFGIVVQAKLEVTDGLAIPMQLGLHSRKGLTVDIDESTIAALAGEALNEVLGDDLPLGMQLDTPAFDLAGGLRIFCLFKIEVPGLGLGLGGRVILSQHGIDFGEAIRIKIPGWYDSPPVSFGGLGASLDVKNKAVSIHASISISPGEAFRWVLRADATGTVKFSRPITLLATGEVKLLQLLTLAESRIQLIPERGSFEVDSKASIGNIIRFKGLFFIEAIHAREVNGKLANIYTLTDLSVFGLNVQQLEAGMNFDLELWASTHLNLAIARVEGEFGFGKGLSSPRLFFEAGITDGAIADVVDINMFVGVSEDYVGADVEFKLLGIPTGVYLEFGSLRDLTVGEVLRRLADLIRLELKPPSGLKIVPGPSRDVDGPTTTDRPTTTKDEGKPEPKDQPVVGATPNLTSIPAFQPAWTVTEYVVVEKDGGFLGTGLFGSSRRVKKFRTDVVASLQSAFGTDGNAFQSTATYYKQNGGHVLMIDSSRTLRVYPQGSASPTWEGKAAEGGEHRDFPASYVMPADYERAGIFLVAPTKGDIGLVIAAKHGATIARDDANRSDVVNLSKIEIPNPGEEGESKKLIEAFQPNELAKDPLRTYVRFAAMLRFRNFVPKELRKLADGITRIQYAEGGTLTTLLHIVVSTDKALVIEDVSSNLNAKEHWQSLAANAEALKSLPLETQSSLTPRASLRSVGTGAWKRAIVFTEDAKHVAILIGGGVNVGKESIGSWSVSPQTPFRAILTQLEANAVPDLWVDFVSRLESARAGSAIRFGFVLDAKDAKPERLGITYVNSADGLEHLAVLDRATEPNGRLHDLAVEKLVHFWNSRSVMVPESERDKVGNAKQYMDLLLLREWKKRGWRANPLGPFITLD